MSELKEIFTLSIDLNKIDESKVKTVPLKNGGTGRFLDVTMYVNSEADQYNNIGSVSLGQSKEEREAKTPKVYIGNAKRQWANSNQSSQHPTNTDSSSTISDDQLPF